MPLAQPFRLPWTLSVGDRLPAWEMPAYAAAGPESLELAGRHLVLCFLPPGDGEGAQIACGFRDLDDDYRRLGANVACVLTASEEICRQFAAEHALPFPLLADTDGSVTHACHAAPDTSPDTAASPASELRTFVAGPDLRVRGISTVRDPRRHASEVLELARELIESEEPRAVAAQAPVLLVPDVLSPGLCRELIELWETQGSEESGFMVEREGRTVGVIDPRHKIRRDHFVAREPMRSHLVHHVFHRVKPEVQRAFNFEITRFEDFRIACYDASSGGYFRPHRDNTTQATSHRVFAMTLNLNAGEYEGGYLRFPEYGPHLYRPQTGEAVIFSCSVLHEATDVTAGRRFALIAFFYGEREAELRQARAGGRRRRGADPNEGPVLEEFLARPVRDLVPILQARSLRSTWAGVRMVKTPMDAWTYQELLFELRPEVVVELGTLAGGTALFLAQLMDIVGHGRVISVETELGSVDPRAAAHPRITILRGRAQDRVADVGALVGDASPVMVIDDASHEYEARFQNCRAYGELVTPGSYLIVEDTNCHHGLDAGPRPGPYEAVERFLEQDDRFVADRTRESFVLTWNPKGYLRRIR